MNMNNQKLIEIVIPIYKNHLDASEKVSLARCCEVFAAYPICIVKPKSLNIDNILAEYNGLSFKNFDDRFFEGISGYNRLMLSSFFYEQFIDYKYILIYQLDAYVFSDQLSFWCNEAYDYIGAPWLLKDKYTTIGGKLFMKFKTLLYAVEGRPYRNALLGNKIGNGGFSLRKVDAFYQVCNENRRRIDRFIEKSLQFSEYNEDAFWALQPHFIYPTLQKAALFSFDIYPERCYQLTGGVLPFGCHGWNKKPNDKFWQDKINY